MRIWKTGIHNYWQKLIHMRCIGGMKITLPITKSLRKSDIHQMSVIYKRFILGCQKARGLLIIDCHGTDVLRQLGLLRELFIHKINTYKISKTWAGLIRGSTNFLTIGRFFRVFYSLKTILYKSYKTWYGLIRHAKELKNDVYERSVTFRVVFKKSDYRNWQLYHLARLLEKIHYGLKWRHTNLRFLRHRISLSKLSKFRLRWASWVATWVAIKNRS